MNEVKQTRMIQLAASLLMRLNEHIVVTQSNNDFYDIVIETPVDKSVCVVKIVDEEYLQSEEWTGYLHSIHTKEIQARIDNNTLLLLKLNEKDLSLDFHLLGWDDWGEYVIEDKIEFHRISQDNLNLFFDEIRKNYHVSKFLDVNEVRVVKKITLNQDIYGHQVPAQIVYFRDFKEDYKMNPHEPDNDDERREKLMNAHLQRDFPNDILDEGILKAVRTKHPDAVMKNALLVTNKDYRQWAGIQNRYLHNEAEIRIIPDFGCFPMEVSAYIGTVDAIKFELDIYIQTAHIDHLYDNEGYDLKLPLNGWVDTLNRYTEVLKSLHRVKDLI